jgi:hypothetical protein
MFYSDCCFGDMEANLVCCRQWRLQFIGAEMSCKWGVVELEPVIIIFTSCHANKTEFSAAKLL